jgi:Tfp pilus assembly protein PilF
MAIAIAGVAAYANGFVRVFLFDDLGAIVRNPQITSLANLAAVLTPPLDTPLTGRPLVQLSFALNYAVHGLDVWGYHAVNLSLHIACALMIFAIIRRLSTPALALGVSLLWVVHPLNSEAVMYLTQRTELMMALCLLLTVYAAVREWRTLAVVACAAGMLCKETMVVAPLVVVMLDWAYGPRPFSDTWRRRWPLYAALAATWIIPAVMLATRGQTTTAGFSTSGVTPWVYLLNQPAMILRYLRLSIWPSDLVLYYGWPLPLTFSAVAVPFLVVASLVVAAIVALIRWPKVGAMAVWICVLLGPTSSLVPIATEVGAERRMYLPLVGVLALLLTGIAWLARRAGPSMRTAPAVVVAIATVVGGATTYARNAEYASALGMAETILARWPTPNAHHLVGAEMLVVSRHADAVPHLRIAAERYAPARFSLGEALFGSGDPLAAVVEFERFLREEPTLAPVRTQLLIAKAYGSEGQLMKAIEHLTLVLAAEPAHTEANGLMGQALSQQQRFADALPYQEAYLRAAPSNADAWASYGVALAAVGRITDAAAAFERALTIRPDFAAARQALTQLGRPAK